MNKLFAAILCLFASTANAESPQKLTTAQSVEVEKYVKQEKVSILKQQTPLLMEFKEAVRRGDKEKRRHIEDQLSVLTSRLKELDQDKPRLWDRLQKIKKQQGLYWEEPAKGKKPVGRWVPVS